jgi:photosystem II stability/assembly factor-like uncharacterized protein
MMKRIGWTVGIAFLLAAVGCSGGHATTASKKLETSFVSIQMNDPNVGWAAAEHGIWRTTDGGNGWKHVLDIAVDRLDTRFFPVFFLDGLHAWAADNGAGALYITEDGGASWEKKKNDQTVKFLDFTDERNGWQMSFIDAATGGQEMVSIAQTTDGGRSWKTASSTPNKQMNHFPLAGVKSGIISTDAGKGFAVGGLTNTEGFSWLYETRNYGHTWEQRELPLLEWEQHSLLTTHKPLFFNREQGIVPVFSNRTDMEQDRFHLSFFHTEDGGDTWKNTSRVKLSDHDPDRYAYDFIDKNQGWLVIGNKLHRTLDGGESWKPLAMVGDGSSNVTGIDFVDARIGWIWTAEGTLFRTTDGGASWSGVQAAEIIPRKMG